MNIIQIKHWFLLYVLAISFAVKPQLTNNSISSPEKMDMIENTKDMATTIPDFYKKGKQLHNHSHALCSGIIVA